MAKLRYGPGVCTYSKRHLKIIRQVGPLEGATITLRRASKFVKERRPHKLFISRQSHCYYRAALGGARVGISDLESGRHVITNACT
ncbi:Uncharacterized protein HZ326_3931 [Fusarium oxysporum f. sp. albedinis]|nr:Uncharacterized protein HZ326_3931 [Fusarium oxysporum f. sp. albedinis]